MSDIVERLRGRHRKRTVTLPDILHEAADEIERLQNICDQRADYLSGSYLVQGQLNAEIERLRAALQDVVNPLEALRRSAESSGGRLNDRAHGIANSVPYIQDIARIALSKAGAA
jgi:hypothetical protein